MLDEILTDNVLPSVLEQCELVLREVGQHSQSFGDRVEFETSALTGAIGAVGERNLVGILDALKDKGLIDWSTTGYGPRISLTIDGQERYEGQTVLSDQNLTDERRDIFICHASEDKSSIVEPICSALERSQISYWYDRGEIKWGDRIVAKVNEGLRISRFVVVVLSLSFVDKNWPEAELNAALDIEIAGGKVIVLPLLCGNSGEREAILGRYPLIRGKRYLEWTGNVAEIVENLNSILD